MKLKTILITIILLFSNLLYGEAFIDLTYGFEATEFEVKNKTWNSDYLVGAKIGSINKKENGIGWYADYKGTFLFEDPKEETQYSYKIADIGVTYNYDKGITIIGGIGYTWEVLKDIEGEESKKENNSLNGNFGILYYYDNGFIVSIEYDTIPKSFGLGIGYSF